MPPGIGVDIERIIAVAEDGKEFLTGETNIEISGNREGLLKLAELITNVAHSGKVGYHTHLMSNDKPPLLRSEDMWLTISLNSQK